MIIMIILLIIIIQVLISTMFSPHEPLSCPHKMRCPNGPLSIGHIEKHRESA
jgi:hypothetical protein